MARLFGGGPGIGIPEAASSRARSSPAGWYPRPSGEISGGGGGVPSVTRGLLGDAFPAAEQLVFRRGETSLEVAREEVGEHGVLDRT